MMVSLLAVSLSLYISATNGLPNILKAWLNGPVVNRAMCCVTYVAGFPAQSQANGQMWIAFSPPPPQTLPSVFSTPPQNKGKLHGGCARASRSCSASASQVLLPGLAVPVKCSRVSCALVAPAVCDACSNAVVTAAATEATVRIGAFDWTAARTAAEIHAAWQADIAPTHIGELRGATYPGQQALEPFTTMSVFARPVFGTCLRTPRVFATTRVFGRPVFGKYLRPPTCLRDDAGLRPTCLWDVSSHAHVSSRRSGSSLDLSSGSVFARPRVFATTRVFARPVFRKYLRPPTCLRDDAGLRPTCLQEVSSPTHVSSRRRGSSPDLSLGVFGTRLRPPTCLRDDACPRPTCLWDVSSHAHVSSRRRLPSPNLSSATVFSREHGFSTGGALAKAVRSGCVFGRPRVFAPRNVFAGNVSSDAHMSSPPSPCMCQLTPRCLRRPCFEASVLDPTCLQMCLRSLATMCTPPGDRNAI